MKRLAGRGFTLVEIIVSIVILGILLAIGLPFLARYQANNKIRVSADKFVAALRDARATAKSGGFFPTTFDATGIPNGGGGDFGSIGVRVVTSDGANGFRVNTQVSLEPDVQLRFQNFDPTLDVGQVNAAIDQPARVGSIVAISNFNGNPRFIAFTPSGELARPDNTNLPTTGNLPALEVFGAGARVNVVIRISQSGDVSENR